MEEQLKESLSDEDIKQFFNDRINIIKYSELKNVHSLDQILRDYGRAIILFEIKGLNNGHWTLLQSCKDKKTNTPYILFFDSYGYKPENELNYIATNIKLMTDQSHGLLLKLLYNQPLVVRYNNLRLQKLAKNINTCGKYCCVKGKYPFLNENEFAEILRSTSYSPDELICLIYEKIKSDDNIL